MSYHPVILLPKDYEILDFTKRPDPNRKPARWAVSRYNEKRPYLYTQARFTGDRNIHLGVDIAAPVGEPIYAFDDGLILHFGYNADAGDYGYVLVTQHQYQDKPLFALWGHLQKRSVEGKHPGLRFRRGDVLGYIGAPHENGGWQQTHLHFQLSWRQPSTHDMPGTCTEADRAEALKIYPDPRLVLGDLY